VGEVSDGGLHEGSTERQGHCERRGECNVQPEPIHDAGQQWMQERRVHVVHAVRDRHGNGCRRRAPCCQPRRVFRLFVAAAPHPPGRSDRALFVCRTAHSPFPCGSSLITKRIFSMRPRWRPSLSRRTISRSIRRSSIIHALERTATSSVPRDTRSGVVMAAIRGPTRSAHSGTTVAPSSRSPTLDSSRNFRSASPSLIGLSLITTSFFCSL